MNTNREIRVLGGGISGLTTAYCLLEAGYPVQIWSKEFYDQTTSAVAAAVWFPYAAEPMEKVSQWSYQTYEFLVGLASVKGSGVRMIDFMVLSEEGRKDEWRTSLPAAAVRTAQARELPASYNKGYIAHVPLADTSLYLPYLFKQVQQRGGQFTRALVSRPEELLEEGVITINCTGLGSGLLFNDTELYPIRGQVLSIPKKFDTLSMVDSMHTGQLAYIIEREADYILGGTDYAYDYDERERAADIDQILDRCAKLQPAIGHPENYTVKVGLRPKRSAIRCEWDTRWPIIHNYGHGGAGYTVSWGCALEVKRLLEKMEP
jgi:D-amino-acid oxidase